MCRATLIAALVLALVGSDSMPPRSAAFMRGADLLEYCTATDEDPAYASKLSFCYGFISLMSDAFSCQTTLLGYSYRPSEAVTSTQLAKVIVKYLSDHPETQHILATSLVAKAFEEAFPCN